MMGNKNGIFDSIINQGMNKKINFEGGYFSFAFGNEIALVLNGYDEYFILNCDYRLFDEVEKYIKGVVSKDDIIQFWINKSKIYDISVWSNDFEDLKKIKNRS